MIDSWTISKISSQYVLNCKISFHYTEKDSVIEIMRNSLSFLKIMLYNFWEFKQEGRVCSKKTIICFISLLTLSKISVVNQTKETISIKDNNIQKTIKNKQNYRQINGEK